jgi:hypothetical protein
MTAPAESASPRRRSKSPHQRSTPDAASLTRAAETSGPGEALPLHLRQPAERALDLPLGDVRLHRGPEAEAFTGYAGARAAQWRNHIFIRPDLYQPDSTAGRDLLGHELVHAGQFSAFGAGQGTLSSRADASEGEARALAPKVLGGEPGSARPTATPAAAVNREENFTSSLPPQICDPNSWTPDGGSSQSDASQTSSVQQSTPAGPASTSPVGAQTRDPRMVDVRSLTNEDLIAEAVSTRQMIDSFTATSPESEAWAQLKREIDDDRRRRIQAGFVFLAEAREQTPTQLVQLQPGAAMGATAIVVADPRLAMGTADVTLTGPIMTAAQMTAYLQSAGLMQVGGEQAERAVSIIKSGRLGDLDQAFQAPAAQEQDQRGTSFWPQRTGLGYGSPLTAFSSLYRTGTVNQLSMYDPNFLMPFRNPANVAGHFGELQSRFDPLTLYGMRFTDLNTRSYVNAAGVTTSGTFPEFDYDVSRAPWWQVNASNDRLVSVAAGGEDYALEKYVRLFNGFGQGAAPAATPDAALDHIRRMSGQANLQTSDPNFAALQSQFLQRSMLAVPDDQVSALRDVLRAPDQAINEGGPRAIKRQNYRELFDDTIHNSPIVFTRDNNSQLTFGSLADIDARAPGQSGTTDPLTAAEFSRLMSILGQRTAARVVPESSANQLRMSSDVLRGAGTAGSSVPATEIWEAPRTNSNPDTLIRRFRTVLTGQGAWKNDVPLTRVTTPPPSAEASARLTAIRNITGDFSIQAGTPEFHAANDAIILRSMLLLPEGQGSALADRVRRINANGPTNAMELRLQVALAGFMSRNPGADMEGILGASIGEFGMSRGQIEGSQRYAEFLRNNPRFQGNEQAHFNAEMLTMYQSPYLRPEGGVNWEGVRARGGRSAGMNAAGAVLGTGIRAGLDRIHGVQHPDMSGWDYAQGIGRDVGVGVLQDEIAMQSGRLVQRIPIQNAVVRGAVGKRLVPGVLSIATAPIMEHFAIPDDASSEEYNQRMGRSVVIGTVSTGAGMAAEAAATAGTVYIIGKFTAAGAGGGAAAGGVGALPGAIIGFIVGAAVAGIVAYELDRNLSGSGQEWDERRAREAADRRRREYEERMRQPMMSFGANQIPLPYRRSSDISSEEQIVIANWFIGQARARQEAEAQSHYNPNAMVCDPNFIAALMCAPDEMTGMSMP